MLCIFYHQKKGVTATWGMEMKGWKHTPHFQKTKGVCVCDLLYADDK